MALLTSHTRAPVRTVPADLLIGERAAHHLAEDRFVVQHFQSFVERIDETRKELQGVVLLTKVHRLIV